MTKASEVKTVMIQESIEHLIHQIESIKDNHDLWRQLLHKAPEEELIHAMNVKGKRTHD